MYQAQPSNGRVRSEMLIITYNSSFEDAMSDGDLDKIEVLSSQIEDTDELFLAPVSQSDVEEQDNLVQKEKERRRVARVVVLISGILFMISVALVAVSLYMSKDIDELVRIRSPTAAVPSPVNVKCERRNDFENDYQTVNKSTKKMDLHAKGEMCQVQSVNGTARSKMLIITYNNSFEDAISDGDHDKIEVLSSQIVDTDEFFLAPLAQSDVEELEKLVQKEKERKRVARVVALVSGILLIISVVLVAVTLYRSKDIDELVRNSNEMLRRHNDRMSQGTQLREQHTLPATVNVTLQH